MARGGAHLKGFRAAGEAQVRGVDALRGAGGKFSFDRLAFRRINR